jgi:hypothetical protein
MSDRDQANDLHEASASGPAATATTVSRGASPVPRLSLIRDLVAIAEPVEGFR